MSKDEILSMFHCSTSDLLQNDGQQWSHTDCFNISLIHPRLLYCTRLALKTVYIFYPDHYSRVLAKGWLILVHQFFSCGKRKLIFITLSESLLSCLQFEPSSFQTRCFHVVYKQCSGFYPGLVSSVPLSDVRVHTPSTSSLASTASWKAGSGIGDGMSGLSVAGEDLLLLMETDTQAEGQLEQKLDCTAVRSL